jgi:hypothetical protein
MLEVDYTAIVTTRATNTRGKNQRNIHTKQMVSARKHKTRLTQSTAEELKKTQRKCAKHEENSNASQQNQNTS